MKKALHELGCELHHDILKVYCETCQELICRDCAVSKQHRNHEYKLITECYPDHHQEIETNLTIVKTKVADINTALTDLITRENDIKKQGEDIKKDIHTQAELIISLVQQSERQLLQQVDTVVQQKAQLLLQQKEEAVTVLNQLKSCEEFVEQSLKVGSQQHVLREKQSIIKVMTTVNQGVSPAVFQPTEEANIEFISKQTSVGKYESIGELKSKTLGKSTVVKNTCYVGKKSTINLHLESDDGSPFSVPLSLISCDLSSKGDSQLIACHVNENQSGIYNITFTPCNREEHQLIIRLGGVPVCDSPFNISPEIKYKPVCTITGLDRPWGVVVTKNGEIVVAECDAHRIIILNKLGEKVRSFGTKGTKEGQFTNPHGVAISSDGYILVTDENRLQKLTFEGKCVKSVGSSEIGSGPLQFYIPIGITVHPSTGQIFIADAYNHCIQVLNNDLTYFDSFGKKGSASEQLMGPHDLAFDTEGYLYVVDSDNHCIKKFTSTGEYISKFGSRGSKPGQLYNPCSIIVDDLVYVSERDNNRISIFDTSGCFIHCFGKKGSGEGEFRIHYGITVDSFGSLYVSDACNDRLVIF